MDIETIVINNKHVPYLLAWYDGISSFSYYITDYQNNFGLMMEAVLKDLGIRKYDGYKIYLHNLGRFDGIFLLKILVNLGSITPFMHRGRLLGFKMKYNKTTLYFKDSLLLLPDKLSKLANSFQVQTLKGIFPYHFSKINYKGYVPDYKFFDVKILQHQNQNQLKLK